MRISGSLSAAVLACALLAPQGQAAAQESTTTPPPRLTAPAQHLFPDSSNLTDSGFKIQGRDLVSPVRVRLERKGRLVWKTTVRTRAFDSIPLPASTVRSLKTGTYRLTLITGELSKQTTVRVHRRWAPLFHDRGFFTPAGFPRCSTITWSYDGEGSPGGTRGVVADLKVVFDRYAELTGLTFTRVKSPSRAEIVISWDDIPFADGIGGSSWDGRTFTSGTVTLSISSAWARTPGFSDRGRGSLLFHETGHVLGLGHVRDKATLMHDVFYGGATRGEPGKAEITGLRYLYRPGSCSR